VVAPRRASSWPTLVVVAASLGLGVWTAREVLAEQPIDSAPSHVWGVFERARQPQRLAILVEHRASPADPLQPRLVQREEGRHDIDIPAGTTLVERRDHRGVTPAAGWMCLPPNGGPSVHTTPVDVDGAPGVRLVIACDGVVSSTTYVRAGDRVRLVSAEAHGQLGPLVAFFDGLIVAGVAFALLWNLVHPRLVAIASRR
jgi:hypothetical protein